MLKNGSAPPEFFIFDTTNAQVTIMPSPFAKGKWDFWITGTVPIFGEVKTLLTILVEGNLGPPQFIVPLDPVLLVESKSK